MNDETTRLKPGVSQTKRGPLSVERHPHSPPSTPARVSESTNGGPGDDKSTTALQKAIRLMRALTASNEPSQLSELAEAVAMPKPSVHRLIMQLEEVGMVQRDVAGRGYTVGTSWQWLAIDALRVVANRPSMRDIMRSLVDRIQESCNLSILMDQEVMYLERVECDWPLRMQLQAGSRVPLHCTASGKLLLAYMSDDRRQRLLRSLYLQEYTPNTITKPAALEKECARIRKTGVSINREEYHLGLIGIGVPVVRSDGNVIASLAIHAPIFRMDVKRARGYVDLLREAATKIAGELGP